MDADGDGVTMLGLIAGLLLAGESWLLEFELGHAAPGALGYERLEDTGVEADEAEGEGAAADAAAALKGEGLGPAGPESSSGPDPLTGVTLVRPMLLTPLLL